MPAADSQLQYMVLAGPQFASNGFNPKGRLFRVFLGRANQGPEEGQVIIQAVVPRRTPLEFWQLPTPFSYAANLTWGCLNGETPLAVSRGLGYEVLSETGGEGGIRTHTAVRVGDLMSEDGTL